MIGVFDRITVVFGGTFNPTAAELGIVRNVFFELRVIRPCLHTDGCAGLLRTVENAAIGKIACPSAVVTERPFAVAGLVGLICHSKTPKVKKLYK